MLVQLLMVSGILVAAFEKMEMVLLIPHLGRGAGAVLKDRVKCRAVGMKSRRVMEPPTTLHVGDALNPCLRSKCHTRTGEMVSAIPGPR